MLPMICNTHSLKDLRAVEVVPPENPGKNWRGVRHYDLITTLEQAFAARGCVTPSTGRRLHLWWDGSAVCGSVLVSGPKLDPGAAIGFQVSTAGRRQLTWYAGGWATDGGGWGYCLDSWLSRKRYTTHFVLEDEIEGALDYWQGAQKRLPAAVAHKVNRKTSTEDALAVVHHLRDRKHLTEAGVAEAIREFVTGDHTAWSLLEVCGRGVGKLAPRLQLDALIAVWRAVSAPTARATAC